MKIHVAAVEALRKKERQDETQFTTKIGGKTSLGPNYFALYNFHSQLHTFDALTTKIGGKTSLGPNYFALYNFHSQLHVRCPVMLSETGCSCSLIARLYE